MFLFTLVKITGNILFQARLIGSLLWLSHIIQHSVCEQKHDQSPVLIIKNRQLCFLFNIQRLTLNICWSLEMPK